MEDAYFSALEMFYIENKPLEYSKLVRLSKDVEYHGKFIIADGGEEINKAFNYLLSTELIKPIGEINPMSIFELTAKGKNVYGREKEKREKEKKRDELQYDLNRSAIRTNRFVIATFISITAGIIFQALTYFSEMPKEQAIQHPKEQGSSQMQLRSLKDSISRLNRMNDSLQNVLKMPTIRKGLSTK
jgi:hypothetical protein